MNYFEYIKNLYICESMYFMIHLNHAETLGNRTYLSAKSLRQTKENLRQIP